MTEFTETLARLKPKTRQRVIQASEVKDERQSVPSIGMNLALKGGLGYGRQILIHGNKSASKSSFCLQLIGEAQKQGKTAAWIDVEQSFDAAWARKLGADPDQIPLSREKTVTGCTEDITDFMETGTDIIVVDSISSMLPSMYFTDKDELKEVENSKQIGQLSRELGIATVMWNYANKNTLLLVISQERNQISATHTALKPMGGQAMLFHSSTVLRLFASSSKTDQIKGEVSVGDKVFQEDIGRPVTWTVVNNKQGPQNRSGQYDFFYDGDFVGIDTVGEVVDYSEKMGIIMKGGAWYNIYGEALQGKPKAVGYLKENPDVLDKLRSELFAKI